MAVSVTRPEIISISAAAGCAPRADPAPSPIRRHGALGGKSPPLPCVTRLGPLGHSGDRLAAGMARLRVRRLAPCARLPARRQLRVRPHRFCHDAIVGCSCLTPRAGLHPTRYRQSRADRERPVRPRTSGSNALQPHLPMSCSDPGRWRDGRTRAPRKPPRPRLPRPGWNLCGVRSSKRAPSHVR